MQSPFGAAKPRESVLATRLGKDERTVLQEELKKDRINVCPPLQVLGNISSVHLLALARYLLVCPQWKFLMASTPAALSPASDRYSRHKMQVSAAIDLFNVGAVQLRLKPEQVEQREQAEAGIQEIRTELESEEDPEKHTALREELTSREEKLEALLDSFQVRIDLRLLSAARLLIQDRLMF